MKLFRIQKRMLFLYTQYGNPLRLYPLEAAKQENIFCKKKPCSLHIAELELMQESM